MSALCDRPGCVEDRHHADEAHRILGGEVGTTVVEAANAVIRNLLRVIADRDAALEELKAMKGVSK